MPGVLLGLLPSFLFNQRAVWPETLGVMEIISLALGTFGLGLFLHCVCLFIRKGRGAPWPLYPSRYLIRRGAYAWVQHPLYLSYIVMVSAEVLFFRSVHLGVYAVCLICVLQLFVHLHEESNLSLRFGAEYEDYRRTTPRWWPRRPPSALRD